MAMFDNYIQWFVGDLIMYFYIAWGAILGIFGMWQEGLDGILSTIETQGAEFTAMSPPTGSMTIA